MLVRLHVYEGGIKTNIIQIEAEKARLRVGSTEENEICIKHLMISKRHCEIAIDGEILALKDLDSIYGIYLNQRLVAQKAIGPENYVQMKNGSCLKLGPDYKIYVECIPNKAEKKSCLMCGKEFQTANAMQEFCFDCKLEMELQMGLEMQEELHIVQMAGPKGNFKLSSIKNEELQKSKWQISVRKPIREAAEGEIIPGYKKIKELGGKPPYVTYLTEEVETGKKRVIRTVRKPEVKKEVFQRAFELQKELERQKVEVVKVYEVGEYKELPYIIMEYYEAGNVVDFHYKTFKNNKYEGARALLMKMLLCIHHLHNAKLKVTLENISGTVTKEEELYQKAHLHLSPNNFLVEKGENHKDRILIADFGFVHDISSAEQKWAMFGCMPREQVMMALDYPQCYGFFEKECFTDIFDEYYDMMDNPAWDVWAAAAIAYYMLTGHYPKQPSVYQKKLVDIILEEKFAPVWTYDYKVPAELARTLDLALKNESIADEFHFRSAEKFIKALQKIQL